MVMIVRPRQAALSQSDVNQVRLGIWADCIPHGIYSGYWQVPVCSSHFDDQLHSGVGPVITQGQFNIQNIILFTCARSCPFTVRQWSLLWALSSIEEEALME